jgi:hypothetical protein
MKCDLCKHPDVHSKNSLLCKCCAEMIHRLAIVQKGMDSPEPRMVAAAAA